MRPMLTITCDYCADPATRIEGDTPVCEAYAREQYGSDWRTETLLLGKRALARLSA